METCRSKVNNLTHPATRVGWHSQCLAWHEILVFHVSIYWKIFLQVPKSWKIGVRSTQGDGTCRASEELGWFQSILPPGSHHSHSSGACKTRLPMMHTWDSTWSWFPCACWLVHRKPAGTGQVSDHTLQRKFSQRAAWCLSKSCRNQLSFTDLSDFKLALSDGKNAVSEYAQTTSLNIKWWPFPESTLP